MRRLVLCIAALVMLAATAVACHATRERFVTPKMTVRKLPKVNPAGVEAAVWKQPITVPSLVMYAGNGLPTQQTQVRIAYDNTNIYFAFRCLESNMAGLTAKYMKPDDLVWRDDSVAVVLSPGKDRKRFRHMCANIEGARYDDKEGNEGKAWNGSWTVKINKAANEWTAFMTIPFSDLGTSMPRPGTVWTGNLLRRSIPADERGYWSPTSEGFQEPEWWGEIVFGDEKAPIVSVATNDIKSPGRHQAIVRASNPTGKELQLSLKTFSGEKPLASVKLAAPPGDSEQKVTFGLSLEGRIALGTALYDASTNRLMSRGGAVVVRIPNNKTRLAKYIQLLKDHNPPTTEAAELRQAVLQELDGLMRDADAALGDTARWANLIARIDQVEKKVARVRRLCADKTGAGYAVGTESSLRQVMRDKLFEGKYGQPARISGCRNEFESTQVVISADKALSKVNVSATALTGPGGSTIPSDRVQISLVDFVKTAKPRYEVDYIGWYPDPLLENKAFDVDAEALQPIWVTVHVPTGIPAGLYKGEIAIKPGNTGATRVPLEVTVWDFDMPVKHTFKTAFAVFPHEIGAWWNDDTDERRRARYKFLLEHRLSPTNIYTPSPLPTMGDIPFCVENGMNQMCLVYTHNKDEKNRAKLAEMVREYETYLKEHEWWRMAYLYGFDEIPPDKYPELRDMYGWVKKTFPDLPRMCTVVPNKDLKGYVDVWVPVTSNWNQDVAEQYVKDGDEVWWYVCVNPHHPYANFFIDYPTIDSRVIFWQCWKYDIPGFLYYAINLWENNRSLKSKAGEAHPLRDWDPLTIDTANGDGLLVYPGPEGRFLSSMRLEAIRDGIEDWECLNILEQITNLAEYGVKDTKLVVDKKPFKPRNLALVAEARKLLAVRSEVVKSVTEYTFDPEVLLKARAEVAEMIEKLGKETVEGGK